MKITFWGVRGSIPSPGPSTSKYGGNTACISVRADENKIIILDAGTGIRNLGKELEGGREDIIILLSHCHWDHIQGFPFFNPIYEPSRRVYIFSSEREKHMICSVIDQMDGAHFPVKSHSLPAMTKCLTNKIFNLLCKFGFNLSLIHTNHPGGGYGYRIEKDGRVLVYLTDNELDPPSERTTHFDEFVNFCKSSDLLIHDAQYTENDIPQKHGWGHSLVAQACNLAAASNVKHLVLIHHDPDRTDEQLDLIQENARAWFKRKKLDIQCTVAFEGLMLYV